MARPSTSVAPRSPETSTFSPMCALISGAETWTKLTRVPFTTWAVTEFKVRYSGTPPLSLELMIRSEPTGQAEASPSSSTEPLPWGASLASLRVTEAPMGLPCTDRSPLTMICFQQPNGFT